MKKVVFIVLSLFLAAGVFAQGQPQRGLDLSQYGVKIEPDKRLIAVLAALDAAGVDLGLSKQGQDFRSKLRTETAGVDQDLKQRLKTFFDNYKSRQPAGTSTAQLVAPFVSLAYALSPDLTEPARTLDLPADLLEVLDFAPLVREFARKSALDTKMPGYLKLYQEEGDKMRFPVIEMLGNLLGYINTRPQLVTYERVKVEIPDPKNPKKKVQGVKTVENERRFFIVPEMLATSGNINFRNIRDDYYAIVPPNTNFRFSEVRRAFLQFVLDPLVIKNAKDIATHRNGLKELLDNLRATNPDVSPDVFLSTMRSLVAAVDAKELEFQKVQFATDTARRRIDFAKTDAAKREISAQLNQEKQNFADETTLELAEAYERGAVLAFYFADQLKGVESSGLNIESSLNQMILGIQPAKEKNRLAESASAKTRAAAFREERRKRAAELAVKNEQNAARARELKTKLDEVEAFTQKKEFGEADSRLQKMLEDFPGEPSIYYALGRVASLSAASNDSGGSGTFDEGLRDKRLEDAKLHYSNAIRSATEDTDPALLQLAYFSLGRIFEFYEDNNYAIQIYQTAMRYGNVRGGAYAESAAAVARLTAPKQP
jgi:hypothetical protein